MKSAVTPRFSPGKYIPENAAPKVPLTLRLSRKLSATGVPPPTITSWTGWFGTVQRPRPWM